MKRITKKEAVEDLAKITDVIGVDVNCASREIIELARFIEQQYDFEEGEQNGND